MVDVERIDELAVVVENDRARKVKQPVDEIRELASIRLEIDVPAETALFAMRPFRVRPK